MGNDAPFKFTFNNIKEQYLKVLDAGYTIITCADYCRLDKNKLPAKLLVNRVDIDLSVAKAGKLAGIFNELGVKASFFLRLHAPEYNPLSFANYKTIKEIVSAGHELGYHSEVIDQQAIWDEDAAECLKRDIALIELTWGVKVAGVASHGAATGLNNLDFWKTRKPKDFGLEYEAYDEEPEFDLFRKSRYVSDSEWTRWKCYDNGTLVAGNRKTPAEHAAEGHPLIYALIHPDTYYDTHFYDNEK